jgi:carbonic anhydrase
MTAAEALALLQRGNADFVADRTRAIPIDRRRRLELARGQKPFAVLVGCSDSRVSPEILFGRGLGDLFIVRVAGNTVDRVALGSIEYALAELGVPLIIVLGHERCGAVQAAVQMVERNLTFPGAIGDMVTPILPAVVKARALPGDLLDNAVRENVKRVVRHLEASSPVVGDALAAGRLKIVGAYYDLDSGRVEFFDA